MKPIITNAYRDKDGKVMLETFEIDVYNTKWWYLNNKFHRANGPAVIWRDGRESWYFNGKLHRTDGPAVKGLNGRRGWYLNDRRYNSEQEYWEKTKEMK